MIQNDDYKKYKTMDFLCAIVRGNIKTDALRMNVGAQFLLHEERLAVGLGWQVVYTFEEH